MTTTRYKVLDTNILLLDAEQAFNGAFKPKVADDITYLVIPAAVIEELDGFKHAEGELGYNSRHATQILHELQRKSNLLCEGVRIAPGYFVRTCNGYEDDLREHHTAAEREIARRVPSKPESPKADHLILAASMAYKKSGRNVELVTQDSNLSLLAGAFGIDSDDWKAMRAFDKDEQFYKGYRDFKVDADIYESLFEQARSDKVITPDDIGIEDYKPNECFRIMCNDGRNTAILARNDPFKNRLLVFAVSDNPRSTSDQQVHSLSGPKTSIEGIHPRNYQQAFLAEILSDQRIRNVNVFGRAGTGKTLLTFAAAYHAAKQERIEEVLITKPIVPVGNTMGYLPGDKDEKLRPWLQGFRDNLRLLTDGHGNKPVTLESLIAAGTLEIQPLETVRGRSIQRGFAVVDEAQNLTNREAKVMITRMAGSSRIVLLGDPDQVDHPALNSRTNGILHVVKNMSDVNICASIYLDIGERSELATYAAERL